MSETAVERRAGRKRDDAHDPRIVEAVLDELAESGYERMTVDRVAARAGVARATVYRRWPTKLDLAVAALRALGPGAGGDPVDTGTLRGDLLASASTETADQQQRRIRVVTGLASAALGEPRLAAAIAGDGLHPWIAAQRVVLQRAVDRGELPTVDLDRFVQVLPLMCACRSVVQGLPVTAEFVAGVVDDVLLPALRCRSAAPDRKEHR